MNLSAQLLLKPRLARSLIPLQKAGLAWLLGPRLMLLEHMGRTSGERRYVSLEVAKDERPAALVVASGFGTRSQWYRNLMAEPACRIWHQGRRGVAARAELLDETESARLLEEYQRDHPRMWRRLEGAIREANGEENPEIPCIRLHLEGGEPTEPSA